MKYLHALRPVLGLVFFLGGVIGLVGFANLDTLISDSIGVLASGYGHVLSKINTANVLLAITVILGTFVLVHCFAFRRSPVAYLTNDIEIRISDDDDYRVEVIRHQIIRAKQPNVRALKTRIIPSFDGTVEKASITTNLINDPCDIKEKLDLFGTKTQGWDCIHIFKPALPFPPYTYLIPDCIVRRQDWAAAREFLRRCAISRKLTVTYSDNPRAESDEQYYALTTDEYPYTNINIRIILPSRFSDENTVQKAAFLTCKLTRIHNAEEKEVIWKRMENRVEGRVHLRELRNATIGFYWKLPVNSE